MANKPITPKEKSDLTFDNVMGKESSGMEKFDHTKSSLMDALCMTQQDRDRIISFVTTLHPPQSKAIEDVLITDRLNTTKERLLAMYLISRRIHDCYIQERLNRVFMPDDDTGI